MRSPTASWFLLALVVAAPACGGGDDDGDDGTDPDPCEGVTGTCVAVTGSTTPDEIDAIFNDAVDNQTIAFSEGLWEFTADLQLTAAGVTIVGAGIDATLLSFADQVTGAQGILVTGDDFTARDFGIRDTAGDGLKIEGVTGVTLENVSAEWTAAASADNGAYGLYPVQCTNVLIRGSRVQGASDAGIYVGQSMNIVIEGSTATGNVAGIEIENSTHADVHDNTATGNTGGILVFNLPGLEVGNGSGTRVYNNTVDENNLENFAPPGNIVGKVPPGTGIVVLAASNIEVFDNTVTNHIAAPLSVVSYIPIDASPDDPTYDPFPTGIYFHDNTVTGEANMPTGELGALLILAVAEYQTAPYVIPAQIWDGIVDPSRSTAGVYPDDLKVCFQNNGAGGFLNMQLPTSVDPIADTDETVADCSHPPLPAVEL